MTSGRNEGPIGMQTSQPLVSVIVPVHNGERYLAPALQSIFDQDYQPFEVIVVDDGSVDKSAEIARSYETRYIYQSNQGVAMARNAGVAAARGDLLAFLDQDDLWKPNKLRVQIAYLLSHPQVGYVLAGQRLFLEPGISAPVWLKDDLLSKDHPGWLPGTLVVRREVFNQIGDFDPSYSIADDADWFIRAKDAGIPMAILPETLHHKRIHDSNLSSMARLGLLEVVRALKTSVDRQRQQRSTKSMAPPLPRE